TAATAFASPASYCSVDNEVCFQWGVPEAAAGSGSGNVYFQLRAPASYAWIGIGTGTQMAGSDMFIVYGNGNGNVTLSTRPSVKHAMPEYRAREGVALLAGSGIVGGNMIANVQCGDCATLSLRGTNDWISAWKKGGDSPASTSVTARIAYHDGHDAFSVDFSQAAVASDSNPFVSDSATNGSGSGSGSGPASGSGVGSPGSGAAVVKQPSRPMKKPLLYAHGVIMSLVFLIGFPVGSMLMSLLGKWLVHASWQTVFFLLTWTGFGTGYVLSRRLDL
ncbi:hypothetical protein E4U54_007144, partial [Claviceps lovelessii]